MPDFSPVQVLELGDARVTFLADGGGRVDPLASFPASDQEGWSAHSELLDHEGRFITSVGGFLIEIEDRKVLLDAGLGPQTIDFPGFGPFIGGAFLDSLAATGVGADEITDLVFTHLHLDHCGWAGEPSDGGWRPRFENARHLATASEWDFWYGGDNPAGPHPERVQQPLADRIESFAEGDHLAPGLEVIATPGHTPGHVSLVLESAGERLYLLGDVIHSPAQLREKDWSIAFDVDADRARKSREQMLDLVERDGALAAANHFPNQVFGRLDRHRGERVWRPVD